MSTEITYCGNGCTRIGATGDREPTTTHAPDLLCHQCINRMEKWLNEIPDRYAMLPEYLTKGVQVERNPEQKATKNPVAPAPLRVAVLDLLDQRRGRKWQGLTPTTDRRGALGTLLAIADQIRDERQQPTRLKATVSRENDTIRRHLDWLTTREWVVDAYAELRILHRELGDAIGQYPPKAVGTCRIDVENDGECGGPLLPNVMGVFCPHCGTKWDQDELRRLGLVIGEDVVV